MCDQCRDAHDLVHPHALLAFILQGCFVFKPLLWNLAVVDVDCVYDVGGLQDAWISHVPNLLQHAASKLCHTQAVDHPYLVVHSGTANPTSAAVTEEQGACALCHDPVEDAVVAGCQHIFCRTCVFDYMEEAAVGTC